MDDPITVLCVLSLVGVVGALLRAAIIRGPPEILEDRQMTPLQKQAWGKPFLDGSSFNRPAIFQPRPGWYVGLSINL